MIIVSVYVFQVFLNLFLMHLAYNHKSKSNEHILISYPFLLLSVYITVIGIINTATGNSFFHKEFPERTWLLRFWVSELGLLGQLVYIF